jgi:hypothetical protein
MKKLYFFFFFLFTFLFFIPFIISAFDFSLSAQPNSGEVLPGNQFNFALSVNLVSGSANPVSFIIPKVLPEITVNLSRSSCSSLPCTILVTINTTRFVGVGSYLIPVVASGGGISRNLDFPLRVVAPPTSDFSFELSHQTESLRAGEKALVVATVKPLSGPNKKVSFAIESNPSFISFSFNPESCLPPCFTTLTFTTRKNQTPTGEYDFSILAFADQSFKKQNFKLLVVSDLLAPILVSPKNKSVIYNLTPTLDWLDVEGAKVYIVDLGFYKTKTKSSSLTLLPGTLKYNQTYEWRVKACKDENQMECSLWSEPFRFSTMRQEDRIAQLKEQIRILLIQIAQLQAKLAELKKQK